MQISEIVLVSTTMLAVGTAIAAIVRDRRKPQLDAAQAETALVNSDAIKAEIKRQSDVSNARRDLRLLDLENWAFEKVRPWGREAVTRFDQQSDVVSELAQALGRTVVPVHLPPFPEMPPLREF